MAHYSFTYEVAKPPRWDTFGAGVAINVTAVLLLIGLAPHLTNWVPLEPVSTAHYVTLVAPITAPRVTRPRVVPVRPHVVAKIERPKPAPKAVATVKPPQPPKVESPKPEPPKVAAVAPAGPPKPAPSVERKTDVFGSAGSATATVHRPPQQVQTGGFGDPNGIPGKGDPKRHTVTVASVGSFDLLSGPGKGNGTGGAHGVSGTIRSAGFADGVASPGPHGRGNGGGVVEGGFGEMVARGGGSTPRQIEKKPNLQPVEIVYKPRPAYTDEARRMHVQGEVLLEVVFTASGSVHINRVVRGLGHGLDDAALVAAQRIRFRPARRDGQPYDSAALVHIVFELAE